MLLINLNEVFKKVSKKAQQNGGECLSKEIVNLKSNLTFQCKRKHIWNTTPKKILKGKWCGVCALFKYKIKDLQNYAKSLKGKCLTEEYTYKRNKYLWECKKGHQWNATFDSVHNGSWCPFCAKNSSYSINDMQELAHQRGGKCLSTQYRGAKIKLKWQCQKGHIWESIPTSLISKNSWCKKCAGLEKHTIEQMHQLAKEKGGWCLSTEYKNAQTKLKWKCYCGYEWLTIPGSILNRGSWCSACSKVKQVTIEEMRDLAKKRGGKCLSKGLKTTKDKLKWECQYGHIWESRGVTVRNQKSWCPQCAKKKRQTIQDMRDLAKRRGGICLSEIYIDSKTPIIWKCERGHIWKAVQHTIKRGSWCKVCYRLSIKKETPEILHNTIVRELRNKSSGSLQKEAARLKKKLVKKGIFLQNNT